jgi:NAD(P)-dependent dehydrogenase (short-subunit alcohol dehydrogenase family)
LAEKGTDILLTYRNNETEAKAVVAEIEAKGRKAAALALDVSKLAGFDSFLEQVQQILPATFGRNNINFLINNAGTGAHALVHEMTEAIFDELLHVHFKGVFFLTQKCLPLITDGGRIVNISTGLVRFAFPGYSAYAAMKGAVEVFTRYLAKEVGSRKITVNVVAPGAIDNDFNKDRFEAMPQVKDFIASQTALGRVGVSEDIGGVVAFLCSADAGWITGQRIEVSGGMFL